MDLSVKTEVFGQDDQSWLGSARGTDSARPILLQTSAFTAGTHYPSGYFTSGIPVGKYTSGGNTGKYGPYTTGASDGTQVLAGFIFNQAKAPVSTATNIVVALLDTGRVILAKLPVTVDSAGQTSNPRFVFV